MKTLFIAALLVLSTQTAIASRSQIISLPDGSTMVCFYHNGGRFVDCQPL